MHWRDVVHPEYARAREVCDHVRRDRPGQPVVDVAAGDPAQERLAGRPDRDRPSERDDLVEPEVQQQPLADLAFGLGDPQVREQREPADLDRHLGLGVPLLLVVLLYLVVLVRFFHGAGTVAAATVSASRTGATSWTRNTLAPRS